MMVDVVGGGCVEGWGGSGDWRALIRGAVLSLSQRRGVEREGRRWRSTERDSRSSRHGEPPTG